MSSHAEVYAAHSLSCVCVCRSSDKTVKVWNASTRQCAHTFKDHSDQVGVAVG